MVDNITECRAVCRVGEAVIPIEPVPTVLSTCEGIVWIVIMGGMVTENDATGIV